MSSWRAATTATGLGCVCRGHSARRWRIRCHQCCQCPCSVQAMPLDHELDLRPLLPTRSRKVSRDPVRPAGLAPTPPTQPSGHLASSVRPPNPRSVSSFPACAIALAPKTPSDGAISARHGLETPRPKPLGSPPGPGLGSGAVTASDAEDSLSPGLPAPHLLRVPPLWNSVARLPRHRAGGREIGECEKQLANFISCGIHFFHRVPQSHACLSHPRHSNRLGAGIRRLIDSGPWMGPPVSSLQATHQCLGGINLCSSVFTCRLETMTYTLYVTSHSVVITYMYVIDVHDMILYT